MTEFEVHFTAVTNKSMKESSRMSVRRPVPGSNMRPAKWESEMRTTKLILAR
jgi:hypothetical protein